MNPEVDVFFILILALGVAFWGGLFYLVVRFLKRQRSQNSASPTVQQFLAGDLGLAKTFWLGYFVIPNVLFLLIYWTTTPGSDAAIVFVVGWFIYVIAASVAVWRAAGRYRGLRLWAWLARGLLLIPVAGLLLVVFVGAATATDSATASSLTAGLAGGLVFTTAALLPYWATKRAAGHVRSLPILLLAAVGIAFAAVALSVGISAVTHALLRSIASASILDKLIVQSIAFPLFACALGIYFGRKQRQ